MNAVARYGSFGMDAAWHIRAVTFTTAVMKPSPHPQLLVRSAMTLVMLFLLGGLFAQTSGKLRLFVDPGNTFEFVLDHQFRMQQREVELVEGPHHFTFWAPERQMVDTTIIVRGNMIQDIFLKLPLSAEYRSYLNEYQRYRNNKLVSRSVPAVVTVGLGAWSAILWGKVTDASDQLDKDVASYSRLVVPSAIDQLKNVTIPAHNQDLKDARTTAWVATALTGVSALGTLWLWKRSAKRTPPPFQDQQKLRFEKLVWLPDPSTGDQRFGLTFILR